MWNHHRFTRLCGIGPISDLVFIIIIIIIIILGFCYHFSPLWRNPSLDSFHWCLSWASLVQVVPRCRLRSSLHLVFGLPRGLNHLRGTQDVALMVHLLSWSLTTWPAHRCFDCLMWSMMSVTPVCCRIQVLCLWSRRVMPSIILSIFLCATASASIWAVVRTSPLQLLRLLWKLLVRTSHKNQTNSLQRPSSWERKEDRWKEVGQMYKTLNMWRPARP